MSTALTHRVAALRSRVGDLARTTPRGMAALGLRRRRVTVRLGASLPAWSLRGLAVAVALGCVLLAASGPLLTGVGTALALILLVRPGGWAPAALVAYVTLALAIGGSPGWDPGRSALLLGTHLLLQLGAVLGRCTWSAQVELRALAVPARRFLAVQLAAQLVALAAAALSAGGLRLPGLTALAATVLGLLLLWLVPRLAVAPSRRPSPTAGPPTSPSA